MSSASRPVASLFVFLFALSTMIWAQSSTTSGADVNMGGSVLATSCPVPKERR